MAAIKVALLPPIFAMTQAQYDVQEHQTPDSSHFQATDEQEKWLSSFLYFINAQRQWTVYKLLLHPSELLFVLLQWNYF